jgi:hypothetical protein
MFSLKNATWIDRMYRMQAGKGERLTQSARRSLVLFSLSCPSCLSMFAKKNGTWMHRIDRM